MAVVKKNTYVTGGNLTNVVTNVDYNRIGTDLTTVEYDAPNVVLRVGSLIECNGSLYAVETADEVISGTGNVVFDSSTEAFSVTASAATWDETKGGYYVSATVRATKWYINGITVGSSGYNMHYGDSVAIGNGSMAIGDGAALGKDSSALGGGGAVGSSASVASGGGGAVGSDATCDYGFSGGYQASCGDGAAVGRSANSGGTGIAIGSGATSASGEIAIGPTGADTTTNACQLFQMTGFPMNGVFFASGALYSAIDTALDAVLNTSNTYGMILGGAYRATWDNAVYLENNTTWQLYDNAGSTVVNFTGSTALSDDLYILIVGPW